MDIDKLFKMPKLPAGGNKRRMPETPTPEMLKRIRTETQPTPSKGKARAVTVDDEHDDDEARADVRDFAPGGDADYFVEEDEEGRFFGGGLTAEQKQIFSIIEKAQGVGEEDGGVQDTDDLNIAAVRRILLKFERAIDKNQGQRSKYPDDPSKFIDSEADLDAALKSLLPLSQAPVLAYTEIVKSGIVTKLVELLTHENVDIVIDVVEVLQELTDEDVGNEGEEDEDEEDEDEEGVRGKERAVKELIKGLLANNMLELLVSNLSRFNESEESDRQGIFRTLGIFENVLSSDPSIARTLVKQTPLLKWLLNRVQGETHEENRGYAGEILAILLQSERENRVELGQLGGVDVILQVLARYRKNDPVDADEVEFMENLFDALCSALAEPEIKKLFLEGEGVELMVIMMKEKMLARSRSIKTLDYALQGHTGTACCEVFVEALGLKTLFSGLMGKGAKKPKNPLSTTPPSEDLTHILGIISSLFSNLPSDSTSRVRLLAKFAENEYEKVERLLEVREGAVIRVGTVLREVERERKEMQEGGEEVGEEDEERWYLRKLDGGLFVLQNVDYILGWLCMEDDGVRGHVQLMLGRKNKSLKDVVEVLKEFRENVADDEVKPEDGMDVDATALSQKQILEGLIAFLQSV